jgi:hypothetical protein
MDPHSVDYPESDLDPYLECGSESVAWKLTKINK